jgi:hypothetical protein
MSYLIASSARIWNITEPRKSYYYFIFQSVSCANTVNMNPPPLLDVYKYCNDHSDSIKAGSFFTNHQPPSVQWRIYPMQLALTNGTRGKLTSAMKTKLEPDRALIPFMKDYTRCNCVRFISLKHPPLSFPPVISTSSRCLILHPHLLRPPHTCRTNCSCSQMLT